MADCRVYWGSHGCIFERGHDGPCLCTCTFVDDDPTKPLLPHMDDDPENGNVGRPPYYGSDTWFYGEDALAATGRAMLPGIIREASPDRIVVGTPGEPEEWSMLLNEETGEWEPWDVYARTLDAPPGHRLDVIEADTDSWPGHLRILARRST